MCLRWSFRFSPRRFLSIKDFIDLSRTLSLRAMRQPLFLLLCKISQFRCKCFVSTGWLVCWDLDKRKTNGMNEMNAKRLEILILPLYLPLIQTSWIASASSGTRQSAVKQASAPSASLAVNYFTISLVHASTSTAFSAVEHWDMARQIISSHSYLILLAILLYCRTPEVSSIVCLWIELMAWRE